MHGYASLWVLFLVQDWGRLRSPWIEKEGRGGGLSWHMWVSLYMLISRVGVMLVVEFVILESVRGLDNDARGLLTEICTIILGPFAMQHAFSDLR